MFLLLLHAGLLHAGLLHGGLLHAGLLHAGLLHAGLLHAGLLHAGLLHAGLLHAGLLHAGLLHAGLLHAGLLHTRLLLAGLLTESKAYKPLHSLLMQNDLTCFPGGQSCACISCRMLSVKHEGVNGQLWAERLRLMPCAKRTQPSSSSCAPCSRTVAEAEVPAML